MIFIAFIVGGALGVITTALAVGGSRYDKS